MRLLLLAYNQTERTLVLFNNDIDSGGCSRGCIEMEYHFIYTIANYVNMFDEL